MKVNVIIFGQLTDIIGTDNISLTDITSTDELTRQLNKKFPALTEAKYVMAVNKKVVTDNINLQENSTIALLPPFSGG